MSLSKTRILLGSAFALSLCAFVSVLTRPAPFVPRTPEVAVSRSGGVRIEARPSHTAVHRNGGELFAEYTVTLERDDREEKRARFISLALVLDTSGSMSGAKMEDARKAAHRLVDLLGERDELALITFGTEVSTVSLRKVTAQSRTEFHQAIDALQPAGSTNISGGLSAGWNALRESTTDARRLMLVSDGQPTEGLLTEAELSGLVGHVHDDAITVTALGVGAEVSGTLMLHLAERGGGMYGYLSDAAALEEILAREVVATRSAVARNVELRFDPELFRVAEVPGRHLEWQDGRAVLHLADLRPNSPTRVLVRLESMRATPGDVANLSATVTWRSLEGTAQRTDVAFSAMVVDDAGQVTRSRDEAVLTRGIGAVGSLQLLAAAAAWERGDVASSTSLLDKARALYGMSPDALAGDEVEEVRARLNKPTDLQGKKEFNRKLEKKKLYNFGLENSGY